MENLPLATLFSLLEIVLMHAHDIINAYRQHVLEEGHAPASVFKFAQQLDISEADFYQHFASFEELERQYWKHLVDRTKEKVAAQEVYQGYSTREKLLHFYFTLFEDLMGERSYMLVLLPHDMSLENLGKGRAMAKAIRPYLEHLIDEGRTEGEVENRPVISDRYAQMLSLQWPWLVGFWLRDTSKGFEKTDTAIEKAVHVAFDLMGRNAIDSLFDFGKFMYQNGMRS